jgi:glyoxylase-like metal-dependent hydrolase (beta-lactamase superfamily II)
METWRIGEVVITKVVDTVTMVPPSFLIVEATPENLASFAWLRPHYLDEEGNMPLSIHTFVIKSPEATVVVDTCIGNDKPRALLPDWNMRQGQYLDDLARVGVVREAVDIVLCTHLHVDHVGWNTMLVDGQWEPTFPQADYLFGRTEWAFWEREEDPFGKEAKVDSILPIFEAGQAVLVDSDHQVAPGLQLIPTPGHTPGHVSVLVESKGERAVITGDLMHHPVQVARPHWQDIADVDQEQALRSRLAFLERFGDERTLVLGSHFATPTGGRLVRDGAAWRFAV